MKFNVLSLTFCRNRINLIKGSVNPFKQLLRYSEISNLQPHALLTFVQVIGASLPKGNYSLDDGTGQEEIYTCLEAANSDLTQQSYSTAEEGAWTMRIA